MLLINLNYKNKEKYATDYNLFRNYKFVTWILVDEKWENVIYANPILSHRLQSAYKIGYIY